MKRTVYIIIFALLCSSMTAQEIVDLNTIKSDTRQEQTRSTAVSVQDTVSVKGDTTTVAPSSVVAVPSEADKAAATIRRTVRERGAYNRDVAVTNSRFALSTNVFDWGYFLTPNVSAQFAVGQHWTLIAEAKYNKWSFNDSSMDNRIRQARQEYSLGFRWWGWYTYTGWWVGCRNMYREYSGNWLLAHSFSDWGNRYIKEEGDAIGVVVSGGYSIQVTRWLDIDLGLGIWGGHTWYRQYSGEDEGAVCPRFGKRIDADVDAPASTAFFVGPAEICVSLIFIL